jgi:dTDP-4-amino-4,6-dideoxygalactose transaminase
VKSDRTNVFFRYIVRLDDRDVVRTIGQFRDAQVEVGRGVYPPLHYYLDESSSYYPNAERAVSSLISIPLYPSLTRSEISYVIETTQKILG